MRPQLSQVVPDAVDSPSQTFQEPAMQLNLDACRAEVPALNLRFGRRPQ